MRPTAAITVWSSRHWRCGPLTHMHFCRVIEYLWSNHFFVARAGEAGRVDGEVLLDHPQGLALALMSCFRHGRVVVRPRERRDFIPGMTLLTKPRSFASARSVEKRRAEKPQYTL